MLYKLSEKFTTSIRPESGRPKRPSTFSASHACMAPMAPGTAPSTPPAAAPLAQSSSRSG